MIDIISISLMLFGSFFILISSIGILRFPDLYSRMHAVTKATSFGILLILLAISLYFGDLATILKSLLIIIFIYLTAPLSAHAVAKSHKEREGKK